MTRVNGEGAALLDAMEAPAWRWVEPGSLPAQVSQVVDVPPAAGDGSAVDFGGEVALARLGGRFTHGVDRHPPLGVQSLRRWHEAVEGAGGHRQPGDELERLVGLVVEAMRMVLGLQVEEELLDRVDVAHARAANGAVSRRWRIPQSSQMHHSHRSAQ